MNKIGAIWWSSLPLSLVGAAGNDGFAVSLQAQVMDLGDADRKKPQAKSHKPGEGSQMIILNASLFYQIIIYFSALLEHRAWMYVIPLSLRHSESYGFQCK